MVGINEEKKKLRSEVNFEKKRTNRHSISIHHYVHIDS
jgi:hypothetical protein